MTRWVVWELFLVLCSQVSLCWSVYIPTNVAPFEVSQIPISRPEGYDTGIPSLTSTSPGFVVIWEGKVSNRSAIYGRFFTQDEASGNVTELSNATGSDFYSPIASLTANGLLVAWDGPDVLYRRFNATTPDFLPLSNVIKISGAPDSYQPKLARQGQRIAMAWSVFNQSNLINTISGAYADRAQPNPTPFDVPPTGPPASQALRDIEVIDGGFVMTWFDDSTVEVFVQIFNQSTLEPAIAPRGVGSGSESQLVVLDDVFGVVWRTGLGSAQASELRLSFFDLTGKDRGQILITEQTALAATVLGQARVARLRGPGGLVNRFVVVWQSGPNTLYFQTFNSSAADGPAQLAVSAPGVSRPSVTALRPDGFVLVWVSNETGSALIYGRVFQNQAPNSTVASAGTPTNGLSLASPTSPLTTPTTPAPPTNRSDSTNPATTNPTNPTSTSPASSPPTVASSATPAPSLAVPVVIVIESTTIISQPISSCPPSVPCRHVDASGGLTIELSSNLDECLWYSTSTTLGQTLTIYLPQDNRPLPGSSFCLFHSEDVLGEFDVVLAGESQSCMQASLSQEGSSWYVIFESSTCSPADRLALS